MKPTRAELVEELAREQHRCAELERKLTKIEDEKNSLAKDVAMANRTIREITADSRTELRRYVLAAMLLMREICAVLNSGTLNFERSIGIKELFPHVDPGVLELNPDTLRLLAHAVYAEMSRTPEDASVTYSYEEWLKLAVSASVYDRKLVVDALKATGLNSAEFKSWSAEKRATYLAQGETSGRDRTE